MQIVKWNQCKIREFLKGSQRPTNKQINSSTSFLIRTNRKHTKCKCFFKHLNRYRFPHILFVRVLRNRIFSHTHQRLCGLFANVSARATGQAWAVSQFITNRNGKLYASENMQSEFPSIKLFTFAVSSHGHSNVGILFHLFYGCGYRCRRFISIEKQCKSLDLNVNVISSRSLHTFGRHVYGVRLKACAAYFNDEIVCVYLFNEFYWIQFTEIVRVNNVIWPHVFDSTMCTQICVLLLLSFSAFSILPERKSGSVGTTFFNPYDKKAEKIIEFIECVFCVTICGVHSFLPMNINIITGVWAVCAATWERI